jgi:hypothetical protein
MLLKIIIKRHWMIEFRKKLNKALYNLTQILFFIQASCLFEILNKIYFLEKEILYKYAKNKGNIYSLILK